MLLEEKYKGYSIFAYDGSYIEIGKNIIDKDYKELNILKNTKRNYVSEIQINNISYIFKEPRNEYIIPQRKFFTLFKNGEALTTVINVNKAIIEDNLIEYAKPFLAIVKRKNEMICYSALIQEKISIETNRNLDEMVEVTKKIHSKGYYHGDCNPSNFITSEDEVKILDTQAKKMFFGNYRAHYDMLTMQIDSYPDMKYPYKKNIFYYFALFIKKFKRLKFIQKIKEKKKKLREKGWKI
ncbi:lipopolysaccharide biosynthesis protein [Fusobacterium nucleatum YWH7199]|uniref:lipopolysaccharide core heptose(II) kinase RfaY n=1 Tax=Fusobacterium nucleatum TaxID=851 RepID=UPI00201A5424|nr:lipopolysaccharide core heptose(II) kinase RfaY [Fusobacterium nucleatum]MCL4580948.1 lipopolysaccharide biosynthesis protein [Fusobacterium nucleatum YWH7199]